MFSVRVTTPNHGDTQLHMMLVNLVVTGLLAWQFGGDYVVIFVASTLLHLLIEVGLAVTGIRKGRVLVYGYVLPRSVDALVRAMTEGPGFCVPAFFVADQVAAGNGVQAAATAAVVIGLGSLYMGWADRQGVARLAPDQEPVFSRRAMTRPGAVMLLSAVNTIALFALFSMPEPMRTHAFTYVASYALLVMLFYLINYNLGVRMVQIHDADTKEWVQPGPAFQAAALTYDSAYEMGLLLSAAYWVTAYLGLFQYLTLP